ncbi:hypothetical protein BKP56_07060 [Marinilactibacillus sp. 15R]|uniref:hypothetical protein n=1 Tax=Marinilactibacillus sp. 15R TaxID=1911586 RepID=UPI00090AB7BC|nr:hypothetical protein [Marinilactibacillus sp. 15R]API89027.1 hypothetical protein BKP56_07060 [Marinilactibacillus sp. 15R]
MSKPIAVVNDNTGKLVYILEGYETNFPVVAEMTKEIKFQLQLGDFGEKQIYTVEVNGFSHTIDTDAYSVIYEVTDE